MFFNNKRNTYIKHFNIINNEYKIFSHKEIMFHIYRIKSYSYLLFLWLIIYFYFICFPFIYRELTEKKAAMDGDAKLTETDQQQLNQLELNQQQLDQLIGCFLSIICITFHQTRPII